MKQRLAWPLAVGAVLALAWNAPGIAGVLVRGVALGALPGLVFAELFARREAQGFRVVLGVAASPLVSALLGWALLRAGVPIETAARSIALGSFMVWTALRLRPESGVAADRFPLPRAAVGWALAVAAVAALPYLSNPWFLVRSDAWVHGGLVWEIATRGLPPQDPRYAGMTLHYVWMYNLFTALQVSLAGGDPFVFMALFNVVNAVVFLLLIARLAGMAWRDPRAVVGAVALAAVGLNAGAWALWPLQLVRALIGSSTGMSEVRAVLDTYNLGTWRVLYSLSAPGAHMLSFLDKFTVGTALNWAWVAMALLLWSGIAWLRDGGVARLLWAAFGVAGMLFFHGVVGLSVLPVVLGTLGVAWLAQPWLPLAPSRTRLLALALAAGLGGLAAAPYTLAISRGWAAGASGIHHQYLRPDLTMPWTLLTSCGVAAFFVWRAWRRRAGNFGAEAWWIAAFTLAMSVFAIVVRLPDRNDSKFAFQVFFPLAVLGGAAFLDEISAFIRRRGDIVAAFALFLLFGMHPAIVIGSFLADRDRETAPEVNPRPGELAMYAWIRDSTETDAVFVDRDFRDLVMVRGRRRLYLGWHGGPEKAGFPAEGLKRRRAVMEDLYGPQAALAQDVQALREVGAPVYVIARGQDGAWRLPGATPVWSAGDQSVYRLVPAPAR